MFTSPSSQQSLSSQGLVVGTLSIFLGLFLLLPSGCKATHQGAGTGRRHMTTITLTRSASGKTVETRAGDTIVVRLDENPSTGYKWAIETRHADVIALQSAEYARAHGSGVGGGGQRILTFKAKKAGFAALQLKLWRAWEGDTSIIERFTVTFHVQE
jgi:inhibitor of cysteine peptidase